MQKIVPCIWFDTNAEEAVNFYTSVFEKSKIKDITHYDENSSKVSGQPEGSVLTVSFELNEYDFLALNGGPIFKLNPSISFMLNFDPKYDDNAKENLKKLWDKLSKDGEILMPLQEYPFSKLYGWTKDKFGVSWQLILSNADGEDRPFITPSLLFTKDNYGNAENAFNFYTKIFKDSKLGLIARYPKGMEPDKEGKIMYSDFVLENQWFIAMESAQDHKFEFNESISFIINCKDQKELDYYYDNLLEGGQESQCGWLKDKFGVSWQITPVMMEELMKKGNKKKNENMMKAMLDMKKLIIKDLQNAYDKG